MNPNGNEMTALAEKLFILLYEQELQKQNLAERKPTKDLISLAFTHAQAFYSHAKIFENIKATSN